MARDKNHRPCLPLKPQERLNEVCINKIKKILYMQKKYLPKFFGNAQDVTFEGP